MPFASIAGHRQVLQLLARAVARQSLPPSLILQGPEGVGKRRAAIALAQVLNCLDPARNDVPTSGLPDSRPAFAVGSGGSAVARRQPPTSEGGTSDFGPRTSDYQYPIDACGKCAACRRIERGMHPDVLMVAPEKDAATIKVEQVRDISERAAYRPYEGRRRVVIIDPADVLERSSQNALLKLLEEPPPTTVLLLVTSQPDALLPTVRSRCPQVRFGSLTVSEIVEVLTRERKLSQHEARAAAVLASGSITRALEAASEDSSEARTQALDVLRSAATTSDRQSLLEQMKAALGVEKRTGTPAAEREQLSLSLQALSSLLRDVTLLRSRAGNADTKAEGTASAVEELADLANADLKDELEPIVARFGRDRAMRAYMSVDRALAALRGNTNAKLIVDWLAYQI